MKTKNLSRRQFIYDPVYEELYDLQNDPYEEKNLAKNEKYQETLKKLRTRCDTFCKICK